MLYAATSADVTDVVVGGEHVVETDGTGSATSAAMLADAIAAVRP